MKDELVTKGEQLYIRRYDAKGKPIEDLKVIKGYESFTGWYWFVTDDRDRQDSVIDGKEYPNDVIYFGFVQGFDDEWGYFSKAELETMSNKVWEIKPQDLPFAGRRSR